MLVQSLGNIGSKEQVLRIAEKLNGKTYFDFRVEWGEFAGNYPCEIISYYAEGKEEEYKEDFKEMVIFCLATEL